MHENKTLLLVLFVFGMYLCRAQTTIVRDPEIENMVKEVNADSLQSYIRTMVAFGTRSTVSSVTEKKKGYRRCAQLGAFQIQRVGCCEWRQADGFCRYYDISGRWEAG